MGSTCIVIERNAGNGGREGNTCFDSISDHATVILQGGTESRTYCCETVCPPFVVGSFAGFASTLALAVYLCI